MNFLVQRAHLIFWLSIPLVWFLALIDPDASLVINMHDTYFVAPVSTLAQLLTIIFGFSGFIYFGLQKSHFVPIRWMTLTHMIFSIDFSIILFLTLIFNWFNDDFSLFDNWNTHDNIISICLFIVIFGQLIFILNIILTLIKRWTSPDLEGSE